MNLQLALQISEALVNNDESILVIISTHVKFYSNSERIINGSELSYRENIELSKYSTLFIGCSSGISWLLTCDSAKRIPMIQFLGRKSYGLRFASLKYDFRYWGIPHSHILETGNTNLEDATKIIRESITNFKKASKNYNEKFNPGCEYALDIMNRFIHQRRFNFAFQVFINYSVRNGLDYRFILKIPIYLLKNRKVSLRNFNT